MRDKLDGLIERLALIPHAPGRFFDDWETLTTAGESLGFRLKWCPRLLVQWLVRAGKFPTAAECFAFKLRVENGEMTDDEAIATLFPGADPMTVQRAALEVQYKRSPDA